MEKRTHSCGVLSLKEDKKKVVLIGWAMRIRDHGGKKFIDLRDREGFTQIVFDPDVTKNFKEVESFRREYLILVNGTVRPRPAGTVNKNVKTGEIEVLVSDYKIINKCDVLPFEIDGDMADVNEELRLEYRYLDLRRPEMYSALKRRHQFIFALRKYYDSNGFVEVETPFLIKSTPEGARDMLVPSRKHPSTAYALPQSPQLFKQLLMVAGFERYYQVARCFRDEDSRKDRQLEFTQFDLEMAFVDFEEFRKVQEGALIEAFKTYGVELKHSDFKIISYQEALERYGSDKPDIRIEGLELKDISDIAKKCGFAVFKNVANQKDCAVKGILVEKSQDKLSRNDVDGYVKFCQDLGAKGMAWFKVEATGLEGSIAKFFTKEELAEIQKRFGAKVGDYIFFIADTKDLTNSVLDALRRHLAKVLGRVDESRFAFTWINNFRLFQWNEEENKMDFEHSPFTMPDDEAVKFLDEKIHTIEDMKKYKDELLDLKADCYDLAMNGIEICSGAQRIYRPDLQKKVFQIIEMPEEKIEEMFGWFIRAYNYGAPFHRGLAFGIDRIVMLLEKRPSIRDVIAFPKNKVGYCPLTHSPSPVDEKQLRELHMKWRADEKKKVEEKK